jgi:catechol 2,3-dioxygenase-like lactoylglutathione lyase family enzyme
MRIGIDLGGTKTELIALDETGMEKMRLYRPASAGDSSGVRGAAWLWGEHGGRDRHIAMAVNDLDDIRDRLDAEDVRYTLSRSGRKALFCHDPDGNTVELIQV